MIYLHLFFADHFLISEYQELVYEIKNQARPGRDQNQLDRSRNLIYSFAVLYGADHGFLRRRESLRQAKKEIKTKKTMIALLKTCPVGRLGTTGRDGYPMIKPLNFAYQDGKIFFHSARAGEKIDDINRNNRVCFEVDLPIALVRSKGSPCKAHYLYQSVIIRGKAHVVRDESERICALTQLMQKYQPDGFCTEFPEDKLRLTEVIRIDIEEMVGKEDLGMELFGNRALDALLDKAQLPIVLQRE